jgi:inward rectifier potassium channel
VFQLSWTVIHPIDDESPLRGETAESLAASNVGLVASLVGIEEATAQTVHARHAWSAADIRFDHRFRDVLVKREDGGRDIDYRRFHDVEKVS